MCLHEESTMVYVSLAFFYRERGEGVRCGMRAGCAGGVHVHSAVLRSAVAGLES